MGRRFEILGYVLVIMSMGAIGGCASTPGSGAAPAADHDALASEITAMAEVDQEVRGRLIAWMQSHSGESPPPEIGQEMTTLDRAHSARMTEIIDAIGWPTMSKVGAEASSNAWLIIQHAVHDMPLMRRALDLMTPLVGTGEVEDDDYALLFDRVNLIDGRPQRYGTQTTLVTIDGVQYHGFQPIDDVEHVDERRASVGLPPLAEYSRRIREVYGVPADTPELPLDITMERYQEIMAAMRQANN